MNIKESPIRRKYLLKQMKRLNTNIEGILRFHPEILTNNLRSQAVLMYHEEHKRYFRIDDFKEVGTDE
jgi:hypothetical protein